MAIECPTCGESVLENADACAHCGYLFDTTSAVDARAKHVFILGVFALATFIVPIIGVTLGIIGLRRGYPIKDKHFAKEGVFFSTAAVFLSVFLFVYSLITGDIPDIE